MKYKTKFSQHVYDYSPLRKDEIGAEILSDLIEGFVTRMNNKVVLVDTSRSEWGIVVQLKVPPEMLTLDFYRQWDRSFKEHGYFAPLLYIE